VRVEFLKPAQNPIDPAADHASRPVCVTATYATAAKEVPEESAMPDHVKKRLEEEIKALERELTTELPAEIKKAVALGDLSENAEYHMAKQRQVFVNARLGQLKKRMGELAMVNLANIPHDKVGFGATIIVFDSSKDEEITYKLVTSEESDVTKGLISTTSPIGRALLGKKVGDTATVVTPNGNRELEVLKLVTIHDEVEEDVSAG
jgi:transcription elongation factor GreA